MTPKRCGCDWISPLGKRDPHSPPLPHEPAGGWGEQQSWMRHQQGVCIHLSPPGFPTNICQWARRVNAWQMRFLMVPGKSRGNLGCVWILEKTGEKIAAEFVGSLGGAVPEHPGAGRSSVIKPLMIWSQMAALKVPRRSRGIREVIRERPCPPETRSKEKPWSG